MTDTATGSVEQPVSEPQGQETPDAPEAQPTPTEPATFAEFQDLLNEPLDLDDVEGEPSEFDGDEDYDEEPTADLQDAEPGEEAAGEPGEATLPEIETFSFRADGSEFPVEGAVIQKVTDDQGEDHEFIVMPREAWNRSVQPRTADRAKLMDRIQKLERQVETVSPENHPDVAAMRVMVEEFDRLLDGEPDDLIRFVENLDRNKEILRLKAEKARLVASQTQGQSYDQRHALQEARRLATEHMKTSLPKALREEADALGIDLDPRVEKAIRGRMTEQIGNFFRYDRAEDEPFAMEALVPDRKKIRSELEFVGSVAGRKRSRRERQNAAALRSNSKAPQQVPAKGAAQPVTDDTEPETREEWLRSMGVAY